MTQTQVVVAGEFHKSRHASGGEDAITPAMIGASPVGHTHAGGGTATIPPTSTRIAAARNLGVPIGTYDFAGATGSVTCQIAYVVPAGGISDLVLTYDNWTLDGSSGSGGSQLGGEGNNPNPLTLKAAVVVGSSVIPVWWPSGTRNVTLDPGGSIRSFPVAIQLPAGATYYVRTFGSYAGVFPSSGYAGDTSTTGSGWTAGDVVDSTSTMTNQAGGSGLLGPSMISARPQVAFPVVGISGDSISVGTGDSLKNGGYIRRALGSIANVTLGRGSQRASTTAPAHLHARRFRYLENCTYLIEEDSVNDIGNNQSFATIQSGLISLWNEGWRRNLGVYATTTTPSTSNDATKETVRVNLNTWLRDGAPILNGAAAASGSSAAGTVRAGQTGHPLVGWFEVADIAETSRNSGVWKTGHTDDGTHPNAVGAAALAAGITTSVFV